MKRVIAILLSLTLLTSMSACGNSENSSLSTHVKTSESVENTEPIHLTNKMTETELSKVDKHSFTLLDAPEAAKKTSTNEQSGNKVRIEFGHVPIDDIISGLESAKEELTDEEYGKLYERFDSECMDIPIFKYYDPYQILQRISCAKNEDIVIIKERMIKRAKQHPEILKEEMKNMNSLKRMITDYLKGKETTIKTVIMKGFAKDLDQIITEYD